MGETIKVRFRQRAALGDGTIMSPGDEGEIPVGHFDEAVHEHVEHEGPQMLSAEAADAEAQDREEAEPTPERDETGS